MEKIKLLLAEDDPTLGKIISDSLVNLGYNVVLAKDGGQAINSISKDIDLYILDVMMPIADGWSVAKEIRSKFPEKPIIFLTALSETKDVVKGYEVGANDYVRKPFSVQELDLRIKELLKRKVANPDIFIMGRYHFNPNRQELIFDNKEVVKLSHKETELLKRLYFQKNELLDKVKVMRELWGDDNFFTSRNLDVYITKLRKKLSQDDEIEIVNVRGFGYKLLVR